MNAYEVKDEILSWLTCVPKLNGCAIPSAGERGVVTGLMNLALRPESNERRHKVLAWIFRDVLEKPSASAVSAKELTDEMWWSLIKWTDAHKDTETGQWLAHGGFDEEVRACWQALEDWEREMNQQLGFDL